MAKTPQLKEYLVALSQPSTGWSKVIKAKSQTHAKTIASKKYQEAPKVEYQVDSNFSVRKKKRAEQEKLNRMGPLNFLIALEIAGVLKTLEQAIPNQTLVLAIRKAIQTEKKINPHNFKNMKAQLKPAVKP